MGMLWLRSGRSRGAPAVWHRVRGRALWLQDGWWVWCCGTVFRPPYAIRSTYPEAARCQRCEAIIAAGGREAAV